MSVKTRMTAIALALIIIMGISGCSGFTDNSAKQLSIEKGSLYDFESCKSDELYNIERVSLRDEFAAVCATYKYTYLSDNYEIKGYISIPASAVESNKPCKCILFNRGGNDQIGLLEDVTTTKVAAELGRVVVASQYRGAGGSGGKDEFGGADVNDVIKLIDFCEKDFKFVDMEDFCAAGVSRGGMMTFLETMRDSRIKRAISVSGVTDLVQSYNERENMREMLRRSIGGSPEDLPEEYEKRSAVCRADEIKVPVMLIHCRGDERVAFSQSERLYDLLKDKVDCTFIKHDGNLHGVLQEPDFKAVGDWLEKEAVQPTAAEPATELVTDPATEAPDTKGDNRDKPFGEEWVDKEALDMVNSDLDSDFMITGIFSDCFFADYLIDLPYKVKINGRLSDEWCVGDRVSCVCNNVYLDKKTGRLEADLVTISVSSFEPEADVAYKPVIYLYPEKKTRVNVRLELDGELTCAYPEYKNEWTVTASPDGTLTDGRLTYNYLYWEGKLGARYDFSSGFCVKGGDTAAFLEAALEKLGLNRREANEFIVYWLEKMQDNPYNVISFQTKAYTDAARLCISPEPDSEIRVFMAWYPSDKEVKLPEQTLTAPERRGFTAVEWGGARVKPDLTQN